MTARMVEDIATVAEAPRLRPKGPHPHNASLGAAEALSIIQTALRPARLERPRYELVARDMRDTWTGTATAWAASDNQIAEARLLCAVDRL